ncbi:MAG: DMT family transporter [Verrucomicrobiota bacterium]|nr:DMT family transporter [Verrucomicrobiota bacterium]
MYHQNRLSLGIPIALLAFLFLAGVSSLVWCFEGKFPTIQILFIQNIVSFFCLLPMALRKGAERLKTDHLPIHLIRDIFGVGSYYLFFVTIRILGLVEATTLNYTAPFFVPFVWWIWKGEKVESTIWWIIILGFIGVVVMLSPSTEIFQGGFMLGILAGLFSAIALSALRDLNLKGEPMTRTLFYYFSMGSLFTFPFAWSVWVPPTGQEWLLTGCIGLGTAIAQILLTIAYRYGTASLLSPLGYTVVIYNGLISYFIFKTPLGFDSLLGTSLIILGGTLTYALKKKPQPVPEKPEI